VPQTRNIENRQRTGAPSIRGRNKAVVVIKSCTAGTLYALADRALCILTDSVWPLLVNPEFSKHMKGPVTLGGAARHLCSPIFDDFTNLSLARMVATAREHGSTTSSSGLVVFHDERVT